MIKIAIINTFDANDRNNWAGIPFYLLKMLERLPGISTQVIVAPDLKRGFLSLLKGYYYNKILGKKYYTWADKELLVNNRRNYEKNLNTQFDVIITFQFYLVDLLKTDTNKIIYWNDATFKNLIGFYAGYSNLSEFTIKYGHLVQKEAFELSDAIIFSSDWAIQTAQSHYGVNPDKLFKIPFASNLKSAPTKDEIVEIIKNKVHNPIIFLFLAGDWERKGGNEAVEIINSLNKKGVPSELYVVGTNVPEEHNANRYIRHYGRIDKNSEDGEFKLIELLRESSFLLLPTHADCTPVAFSEANSYGLPVLSANIGGVSSVIMNNVNGHHFALKQFVESAEQYILNNLPGTTRYNDLCYSSFDYYNRNLSWSQVELKFKEVLNEIGSSVNHKYG
jgi:glycosyltransferase involved in cell wall biosynthesis